MYAVVEIKGFQYKLEKGDILRVPKYDVKIGKKIKIPEVLLVSDKKEVSIGSPYVESVVVEATVTGHDKDKKIIVFKKKRRKDYSVKKGHRQEFTEIVIDNIKISKPKKTTATKKTGEASKPKKSAKSISKKAVGTKPKKSAKSKSGEE